MNNVTQDLEEQAAGSRAGNADTDGDGAGDFLEYLADWRSATNQALATPSLDNSTPVRLRVTSCYKCHATALQVGDYSLISMPEYRRYTTEEVARLAKGKSYPVQVFAEFDPFDTNRQYYGAEILAVTNPPGFLVEDPDGILGPQRVATSNLMAKIAWLHIPRLELGVDANRDDAISFLPKTNDQTSASRPYTFWLNNDRDSGSDDQAEDLDPFGGTLDNVDTVIANQRDLEDFTRLHLKLDAVNLAQLQQGTLSLRLEWRSVTGTPSLRVYRAYETSGTNRYLFDSTIAASQLAGGFGNAVGTVSSGSSLVLPASVWTGASGSNVFRPFLFEGAGAGQGQLFAVLVNAGGAVAESTPVYLRLAGVTNLFEHFTAGDTNAMDWNQIPLNYTRTYDSGNYTTNSPETIDYILFVHGWRMQPWERRAFAHTAFKRLYWQGYRGRFGLFSWPTEWAALEYFPWIGGVPDPTDPRNFDRSERKAWRSGRGLERLLVDLNHRYPNRVHMFAHSMGNVVASEALHHVTERNGALALRTYVACQGAVAAHCFDPAAPSHALISFGLNLDSGSYNLYRDYPQDTLPRTTAPFLQNLSGAGRFVNYLNAQDNALSAWEINQNTKPDFDYQYSSRYGFFRGTQLPAHPPIYLTRRLLYIPGDTYEIFAHAAEARSKALGAQGNVAGPFFQNGQLQQLDLGTTFFWANNPWEHSAEFRSTIMRRTSFWIKMLQDFQILSP